MAKKLKLVGVKQLDALDAEVAFRRGKTDYSLNIYLRDDGVSVELIEGTNGDSVADAELDYGEEE